MIGLYVNIIIFCHVVNIQIGFDSLSDFVCHIEYDSYNYCQAGVISILNTIVHILIDWTKICGSCVNTAFDANVCLTDRDW